MAYASAMDSKNTADYRFDVSAITFHQNVTINRAARMAMVAALHDFFQQTYHVKPDWVQFHFSNQLDKDVGEKGKMPGIGVQIAPTDAALSIPQAIDAIDAMTIAIKKVAPQTHKTFHAHNLGFSAKTWGDVISGLNAMFNKAGSTIQIDPAIVKQR